MVVTGIALDAHSVGRVYRVVLRHREYRGHNAVYYIKMLSGSKCLIQEDGEVDLAILSGLIQRDRKFPDIVWLDGAGGESSYSYARTFVKWISEVTSKNVGRYPECTFFSGTPAYRNLEQKGQLNLQL